MAAFEKKKKESKIQSKAFIRNLENESLNKQDLIYSFTSTVEQQRGRKVMTPEMTRSLDKIQSPGYNANFKEAYALIWPVYDTLMRDDD